MYALVGWNSPVLMDRLIPDVTISIAHKVECQSINCVWYDFAENSDVALELKRAHEEWHEEGCPSL